MKRLALLLLFTMLAVLPCTPSLTYNAGSDDINYGSDASIDDLDPATLMIWVNRSSSAGNQHFMIKGYTTGWKEFRNTGSGSNEITITTSCATTALDYSTNDTPLTTGSWQFLAVKWNMSAAAGQQGEIYSGTLTALATESTYGTSQDCVGAVAADAANSLFVGSNTSNSFIGTIAFFAYIAKDMSLSEIQEHQFHPHVIAETRIFSWMGFSGTTTQVDWSGTGNSGAITSATISANVPLPQPY